MYQRRQCKDINTSDASDPGEVGFGLASAFVSPPFTLGLCLRQVTFTLVFIALAFACPLLFASLV